MGGLRPSSYTSLLPSGGAFSGQMQEFRYGLDVPVGISDVDMPQVRGEFGQFAIHVKARPIPFDHFSRGEGVPLMPISA